RRKVRASIRQGRAAVAGRSRLLHGPYRRRPGTHDHQRTTGIPVRQGTVPERLVLQVRDGRRRLRQPNHQGVAEVRQPSAQVLPMTPYTPRHARRKEPAMKKEPAITIGTISAAVAAVLALITAFGIPVTEEQ